MTTPPLPPMAQRPVVNARPGRLTRWKLTEPARLYGYGVLSALLLVLAVVGTISEDASAALTGLVAAVLGLVPAVESIRVSVYSPASVVATLLDAGKGQAAGRFAAEHQ